MKVQMAFEPRDVWIGVYWTFQERLYKDPATKRAFLSRTLFIYVCLIPMLPIIFCKQVGPLGPLAGVPIDPNELKPNL